MPDERLRPFALDLGHPHGQEQNHGDRKTPPHDAVAKVDIDAGHQDEN